MKKLANGGRVNWSEATINAAVGLLTIPPKPTSQDLVGYVSGDARTTAKANMESDSVPTEFNENHGVISKDVLPIENAGPLERTKAYQTSESKMDLDGKVELSEDNASITDFDDFIGHSNYVSPDSSCEIDPLLEENMAFGAARLVGHTGNPVIPKRRRSFESVATTGRVHQVQPSSQKRSRAFSMPATAVSTARKTSRSTGKWP